MKLLIQEKANPNISSLRKITNDEKVTNYKTSSTTQNKESKAIGYSALGYACSRGLLDIVIELCKAKSISLRDTNVIHLACLSGQIEIIKALLKVDPGNDN